MSAKKKIIISIVSLVFVLLIACSIVVAVTAAQTVNVQSAITISFSATDVAADVTVKYQTAAESTATTIGTKNITGTEADNSTLKTETISITNLTQYNNYVDFIFEFTNKGDSAFTATLTPPKSITNFTPKYTVPPQSNVTKINDTSFTVAGKNTTKVIYTVRYTISVTGNPATISGNFYWELKDV